MNILIQWKPEYELGIKEVDQQHKKLVDMINQVYDSYVLGAADLTHTQVLSDMKDYAFVHFKAEEHYFAKYQYKHTSLHLAEHNSFLMKIEEYQNTRSLTQERKQEMIDYLRHWLVNHILQMDRKYAESFARGEIL